MSYMKPIQWKNENVVWKKTVNNAEGRENIETPHSFQARKRIAERNRCKDENVPWKRTDTFEGPANKQVGWMKTFNDKEDYGNKELERKKTVQVGSMRIFNNKEDLGSKDSKELERKKTVQVGSMRIFNNKEDLGSKDSKELQSKKTVLNENRPLQGFYQTFSKVTSSPVGLVDFKNQKLWEKEHTFKIPSKSTSDGSTTKFCYTNFRLHPIK